MKIRIKFSKRGAVKFIGHLDVMRYFQKLMRRADIPIAYSGGMSPHQVMSFALPLGIGLESDAEYMDIEITEPVLSAEAIEAMNKVAAEGIMVLSFRKLPETAGNAMASVAAADYLISFREKFRPPFSLKEAFADLMGQEEIIINKKTKRSEQEIDLKPSIYRHEETEDTVMLRLSCGSVTNIKPELVMEALYRQQDTQLDEFGLLIRRLELYTIQDHQFLSLNEIGMDIIA
ncbi:MAG: TIGR03936 family radical SAM-associated protein [Lachnospiraceae bacterium]